MEIACLGLFLDGSLSNQKTRGITRFWIPLLIVVGPGNKEVSLIAVATFDTRVQKEKASLVKKALRHSERRSRILMRQEKCGDSSRRIRLPVRSKLCRSRRKPVLTACLCKL